MLESKFQSKLKKEIKERFPGAMIIRNDPNENVQGIPDLLVLYKDKWAALEVKRSAKASKRPNQDYYIGMMDNMSFARFISPENEEECLNDMERAFGVKK